MRRTEGLLHEALASLTHEKAYEAIAVKEILTRADVGRSTFYTHFRDKDELLASGIRDMVRGRGATSSTRPAGRADGIPRFSLRILEHIERYQEAGETAAPALRQDVVHEHLRRVLVELIDEDLRFTSRRQQASEHAVPTDLLAQHVASTFVLVLNWWLGSEKRVSARRVNDLFRALVSPAVAEGLG